MTRALVLAIALATFGAEPAAQERVWPTERPPRPLPARQANFPPYEIRALANGLQVVAVLATVTATSLVANRLDVAIGDETPSEQRRLGAGWG